MTLDATRWRPAIAVAHRGSRVLWPENTIEAFQGAYDIGYRHFETDLHLTADGVLVCFHDPTVDRTTDGTGPIADMTLAEVKELDAGFRHRIEGEFAFRGRSMRVPTLEELLTTFPDTSVIVDMKADGLAEPLSRLVRRLGLEERLIVGSFSDERIDVFRALTAGRVPVSTGPLATRMWVLSSRVGRGAGGMASALQVPTQLRGVRVVDDKLVKAAHGSGMQVHVWTVNEVAEMTRLLDLGVDGLITDRPDRLKDVLVERGDWNGK